MFRTEDTEEEMEGGVEKWIPRRNILTQTGVRFRIPEKKEEGDDTNDLKMDSYSEFGGCTKWKC